MTRLWIFSDLHQEWDSNAFDPLARAPAAFDVVVVAGDVHTPGTRAIDWLADRFAGLPVVYVLGNHDLYRDGSDDHYTYQEMYARSLDHAAARGISLLVDGEAIHHGVRFIGGTLWTDQRLGTQSRGHAWNTARRGMNDYRQIRRGHGSHPRLRVDETVAMHDATIAYLDAALAVPFDGPSVVVTHHAPSARSLDDLAMDLRWCYASNHEDLVHRREPDVWLHGHLHNHSDYLVGRTRVLANPRGHVEEARTSGFVPDMRIDLHTEVNWALDAG